MHPCVWAQETADQSVEAAEAAIDDISRAEEAPVSVAVPIVQEIVITGNRVASEPTILARLKTVIGERLSQKMLGEDIKRLYATGYFTDVQVELEDLDNNAVKVLINVKEKMIIAGITFQGNPSLRQKKLAEVMSSQNGDFLDPRLVKEDAARIRDLYQSKGFSQVMVTPTIDRDRDTNQANLSFIISEGGRQRIKKIEVAGNVSFRDKKIRKLMKTKRDTLFTSGYYKAEVFESDMARITAFYQREGFLDVAVASSMSTGDKAGDLIVLITITEGNRYYVDDFLLQGAVLFPAQEIRQKVSLTSGAIFSKDALYRDIAAIQGYYFDRGYIFARVNADTRVNYEEGLIHITFNITENEVAYVNKIKITGNNKTKDIVIRRELRINPGEKFDGSKITRSKERLYNLGFFEEVTFDTNTTTVTDKQDLIVTVKEAKTGEMAFGGGFSSVDKFLGFVEIAQRNFDISNWETFTGDGQDLRLRAQMGSVRREYEISFTEPWFLDKPLLCGVDAYQRVRTKATNIGLSFNEERLGGALRLGKEFGEYMRGDMTYRLESVDISEIDDDATQALKNEEGRNLVSSLLMKFTYDKRNNRFNPSEGHVISYTVEFAGNVLGGDKEYVKNHISASQYFKYFDDHVLALSGQIGFSTSYGDSDTVPIYERFFAGGTYTVRGYEERDLGPKDPNTGDPVGGEGLIVLNAEYVFPIIEILKGALFFDAGNVWEDMGDIGSDKLYCGTGIGIRLKTPMGPLRLDFGYPLNGDEEEQDIKVHFSMSRGF